MIILSNYGTFWTTSSSAVSMELPWDSIPSKYSGDNGAAILFKYSGGNGASVICQCKKGTPQA